MQTYTSANTSINQKKLPAVFSKAPLSSMFVMDYGCGRYTDHIREAVESHGAIYLPFDPYNQSSETNQNTMDKIGLATRKHISVDVVCSNVLNVIDSEEAVAHIADMIERIVTVTGGTGYVTVYEGDRSGHGRPTGPDQYQRNEPLRAYLKYFTNATAKHGMIIVNAIR